MFTFLKRLLAPGINQTAACFPRNRFARTDWPRELSAARRRFCNEDGRYAEQGAYTELELGETARYIVLYFKNENEAECLEILGVLNEIDNRVQERCERAAQSPIPEHLRRNGYTPERWRQAQQFGVSIVSCEETPPQINYVGEHVNSEFSVYLAKRNGRWQAFWDREGRKPVG